MLDIMDLLLNKAEILMAMDKEVPMVTINHAKTTVDGYTLEGSLRLFLSVLWMLSKRGFKSTGYPSLATEVSEPEVIFLGQLRHANLVKLNGYCCEEEERLLVYEFMPKGSLENHLFRRLRQK